MKKLHGFGRVLCFMCFVGSAPCRAADVDACRCPASPRGCAASAPSAPTVVWASGSGNTILRTDDGGATWKRTNAPTADRLDFRDIDAVDERTAYVLSIGRRARRRASTRRPTRGETWTLQFTNDDPKAFFDAMAFWDADHGIAVSDSVEGAVRDHHDRERRPHVDARAGRIGCRRRCRTKAPSPRAARTSRSSAATTSGSATGAAARARVLRSTDRGRTWQIAETPLAAGPSSRDLLDRVSRRAARRRRRRRLREGARGRRQRRRHERRRRDVDAGEGRGLTGFRSVVAYVPGTARRRWIAIGPRGADWSDDDGRTWTRHRRTGLPHVQLRAGGNDRLGRRRARDDRTLA